MTNMLRRENARRASACRLAAPWLLSVVMACSGGAPETASTADSGSSAASGAALDPCALVTAAEAGQALGAPVGPAARPGEANLPPRLVTCRYVAPRGPGVAVMTVMVRSSDSASEARTGFGSAREQFAGAEPVAGLGDEAFWLGNQLNVLQGTVYLNITGEFDRATAERVARTAVGRLP